MICKSLFLSIRLVSTIQKSPHLYGRLQLSWLVPAEVSPPASHVSLTNTLPGAGALDPGTERSIPPEMITNVIPIDSTAFTEPCNPTVNVRVGDQQTVDEPANGTSRNHLERAAKKAQHNEEFGYDAAHGEYPLTAGISCT
jgi:hypothetical protein